MSAPVPSDAKASLVPPGDHAGWVGVSDPTFGTSVFADPSEFAVTIASNEPGNRRLVNAIFPFVRAALSEAFSIAWDLPEVFVRYKQPESPSSRPPAMTRERQANEILTPDFFIG